MDRDIVKEVYLPYISDPVKKHVRKVGTLNLIFQTDEWGRLAKLYVKLGLRHPGSYVKAWVDQTCGFWNGGYSYWRWYNDIYENEYGIKKTICSEKIKSFYDNYLWLFENNRMLQIFLCIGFYVWIDFGLCIFSIIRKDKTGILLSVPIIATILSLIISSPVFAEFRYVYAIFCTLPFVIVATFISKREC